MKLSFNSISSIKIPLANKQTKTNNQIMEFVLFFVVWVVLIALYVFAGFASSSGASRYKLESQSYTPNIIKSTLLTDTCGSNFFQGFYARGNDQTYLNTNKCQAITQNNYNVYVTQVTTHLTQINNTLAAEWKRLTAQKRKEQLIANETELVKINNSLKNRQKWLNLNDDGTLDSIHELIVYSNTHVTNKPPTQQQGQQPNQNQNGSQVQSQKTPQQTSQQLINQATKGQSNNTIANTGATQVWSNIDLAVSLLAITQGDERFLYSRLFKTEPELAELMNKVASDISMINQTNKNQQRAKTAQSLLPKFGSLFQLSLLPQLFVWSFVTFILLNISRTLQNPLMILPINAIAWGLVIIFVSHDFVAPVTHGMVLFCIGVGMLVVSLFGGGKKAFALMQDNRQQLSSPWLYPLFIFFTTFGLWILVDLSTRGYLQQRYFFINHFSTLFSCYVLIGCSFLLNHLFTVAIRWLAFNNIISAMWANNKKQKVLALAQLCLAVVGMLLLVVLLRSDSAKVAELAKIWFVVFFAMFLAVNQRNLIHNVFAVFKKSKPSIKKTIIIVFALMPVFVSLAIANEKGTLLTILFVLAFFIGIAIANRIFQLGGRGQMVGIFVTMAVVMVLMIAIINISGLDDRTAERVLTWVDPFVSTNDQLAIIHWFRDSAPALGYGFGDIPWCGFSLSAKCHGVPLQMQSDYTITSIIAALGTFLALLFVAVFFVWLYHGAKKQMLFATQHTKSTITKSEHMLISWVILLWVIVTLFQAIVTICGNLGILPLTGITLPFISYGNSSLLFNTFMFCLLLYVPSIMQSASNKGAQL